MTAGERLLGTIVVIYAYEKRSAYDEGKAC